MKRNPRSRCGGILVPLSLLAGVALPGWAVEDSLARRVLDWRDDWPGVSVEVPFALFDQYQKSLREPQTDTAEAPPLAAILSSLEYRAAIHGELLRLELIAQVEALDPKGMQPVPILPAWLPWREVERDGARVALREQEGWFHLDPAEDQKPGRVTLRAHLDLRGRREGDSFRAGLAMPAAALATLQVDSSEAWEVRASRSPMALIGDSKGTHGLLGLSRVEGKAPGNLEITWRPPQAAVSRTGTPLYESYLVWHLGEGVQELRGSLDVRIAGGEREELRLSFPDGADRIQVTGPDVQAVRVAGRLATVHLKGRIGGAVRLDVQCAIPWPAGRGKTSLAGLALLDGRMQTGALVVTSETGGVVLEEEKRGLTDLDSWAVPARAAALTSAPVLYAYALTGDAWQAGVEVVSLSELPVRETLIDQAACTLLLRPDGATMTKVQYRMRNRSRQFLRVSMPDSESRLLLVRVADKPVPVSRSPDGGLLIPLEKSLQTVAGAVSFMVEIVYESRTAPIGRQGDLELALPTVDLPVAKAECTLYAPEGLAAKKWEGAFTATEKLSATVERMEYGRGHLRPAKPQPQPEPDSQEPKRLLAENRYRAALAAYQRNDLVQAETLARKSLEGEANGDFADDAKKLLANIEMVKGERAARNREERIAAQQLAKEQFSVNIEIRAQQNALLAEGWQLAQKGDEQSAADRFRAAESIGQNLRINPNDRREQDALLARPREWLKQFDARQLERTTRPSSQTAPQTSTAGQSSAQPAPPTPNVAAQGKLAYQRSKGLGNQAQVFDRFDLVTEDVTIPAAERAAKELIQQKRYAEATELLRKAQAVGGPNAQPGVPAPSAGQGALGALQQLEKQARSQWQKEGANAFSVSGLVGNEAEGRSLARFLGDNYGGQAQTDGKAPVQYRDGQIVVTDMEANEKIASAIKNLKRNQGQKVALNSRTLALSGDEAAKLGVAWNGVTNGRWAIVDEGMLNTLVAIERRKKSSGVAPQQGTQEIVPGTGAFLPNGMQATVALVRDDSNRFQLDGQSVDLPHEQVLLTESNGIIVAVRAGATQFWMETAAAPAFAEVPMEIAVPAVGVPVRFEKLLVRPDEPLVISCHYRFREVQR